MGAECSYYPGKEQIAMFTYEEYDYNSLLDDFSIDPDSADALYALAQFCRTGKGCPVDTDAYRKYLQRAADLGHAQAKAELAAAQPQDPAPAAADYAKMTLRELVQLADENTPAAQLPAARKALELGDTERAVRYLKTAGDFMSSGAYTYPDEEAQSIYMTLAQIMEKPPYSDEAAATHYYGMAQELGSTAAASILEQRYRTGTGVEQDDAQADVYGMVAAQNGSAVDKLNYAVQLMDRGQNVDAAVLLERAKDAPDQDAANTAALLLMRLNMQPATPELMRWAWAHMAEDGKSFSVAFDGQALSAAVRDCCSEILRDCYNCTPEDAERAGLPLDLSIAAHRMKAGTSRDDAFAWANYAQAHATAEEQQTPAYRDVLCRTAHYYRTGTEHTAPDREQALYFYTLAAQLGCGAAMAWAGLLYKQDKNYPQAFAWFQKGAVAQDARSQAELGLCYMFGRGVQENRETAYQYFVKAAQQGNSVGETWLGHCYENGWCVATDAGKALELYLRAAGKADPEASAAAARCYYQGIGTEQDYKKAASCCERVLKAPDGAKVFAYNMLGKIKLEAPLATDRRALDCFQEAYASGDHCEAAFYLAKLYGADEGMDPKTDEKVDAYLAEARANGYPADAIKEEKAHLVQLRKQRAEEAQRRAWEEQQQAQEKAEMLNKYKLVRTLGIICLVLLVILPGIGLLGLVAVLIVGVPLEKQIKERGWDDEVRLFGKNE